jgi:hypothetical protein
MGNSQLFNILANNSIKVRMGYNDNLSTFLSNHFYFLKRYLNPPDQFNNSLKLLIVNLKVFLKIDWKLIISIVFLYMFFFQGLTAYAQNTTTQPIDSCIQKDIRDLFNKSNTEKKLKKNMMLVLPNISSNPLNGLLIGVAGSTGFYLSFFSVFDLLKRSRISF